jgi:ankyrin repeat protein
MAVALCMCCAQDGVTALFRAANNGRTDCLQLLLENGAEPEVKDNVRVIFGAMM